MLSSFFSSSYPPHLYPDVTKLDVLALLHFFKAVILKHDKFLSSDGSLRDVLHLQVDIAVPIMGHNSISIYLHCNHPYHAPLVKVKLPAGKQLKVRVSEYVDAAGKVSLPYLLKWCGPASTLIGLVQNIVTTFGKLHANPEQIQNLPNPDRPSQLVQVNEEQLVKDKLLEKVKRNLRPTLISQKGGVSLERLNMDYSELMGEGIPFRQLQFQSMETFLRSIPDICTVQWRGGELVVAGVADENTQHIVKMVSLQKTKTRKKKKGGGPTRPMHRPPLTWGGGRRDMGRIGIGGHFGGSVSSREFRGGYQTSGQSSGNKGSMRTGGVRNGFGYQGLSLGAVPKGSSGFQGSKVGKKNFGKVESVREEIKNLSMSGKVFKETVGGVAVFGNRVEQLLEGRVYGLFSSQVEKMYEKKWEEVLPSDWCKEMSSRRLVRAEQESGRILVYSGKEVLVERAVICPEPHPLVPSDTSFKFNIPNPVPATSSTCSSPVRSYSSRLMPKITLTNTPESYPPLPLSHQNPPLACSSLSEINSQPPPLRHSPNSSRPSLKMRNSNPPRTSLPPLPFPESSNWDICVCMVIASNLIYFKFNDNSEKLEELVTAMDEFYAYRALPIARSKLRPGLICCAQVEDGFYRVKIVELVDDTHCDCFFLDIGMENLLDCKDLQELPSQFLKLPGQAVAACLAKVDHLVEEEVVEFVTQCLDFESFVALVDNREELGEWYEEEQETPFLFLMDSNCTNMAAEINKFIIKFTSRSSLVSDTNINQDQCLTVSSSEQFPRVTSSHSPAESSSPFIQSKDSSLVTSSLIPEVSSSFLSTPDKSLSSSQIHIGPLPTAPLPLPGDLYDVTVIQTTSPYLFQTVSYLRKITYSTFLSQMTKFYSDPDNHTQVTNDYLTAGSMLAFRDSTSWHRAKVVRVISLHPLAVRLKLVDQGCFRACSAVDKLQPLRVQFGQLPPQACAAKLVGVESGAVGWGEEVLDWFKEITVGKDFVGRVKDIVNSDDQEKVMVMELIDTCQLRVDMNINEELMKHQFVWAEKFGLKL